MKEGLTDTEKLAYYRNHHINRKIWTVVVGIICFILGFVACIIYYTYFWDIFSGD